MYCILESCSENVTTQHSNALWGDEGVNYLVCDKHFTMYMRIQLYGVHLKHTQFLFVNHTSISCGGGGEMLVSQTLVKFLSFPDLFTPPYKRKALEAPADHSARGPPCCNLSFLLQCPFSFAVILSNSLSSPKSDLFLLDTPIYCATWTDTARGALAGYSGTVDQRAWLESLYGWREVSGAYLRPLAKRLHK